MDKNQHHRVKVKVKRILESASEITREPSVGRKRNVGLIGACSELKSQRLFHSSKFH